MPERSTLIGEVCSQKEFSYHLVTPEQKLLWAVLERAIQDALGNSNQANVEIERQARVWLLAPVTGQDKNTLFSLSWICEWLDISPSKVRDFYATLKRENYLHKIQTIPVKLMKPLEDD